MTPVTRAATLVFLFCSFLGCYVFGEQQGGDTFYFSVNPEANSAVVAGRSTTLRCRVSAERGVTYYWQQYGKPLVNTTRRHQRGPDLHITRADRERDAGEFTCIALNTSSGFSLTSQAATINVQWLGDEAAVQLQTPEGGASTLNPGNDIILRCTADGSGELRFEWYRNAEKLSRSERIVPRARRLHLRNVSAADNGIYRCAAHNEAGTIFSRDNFALAVPAVGAPLIRVVPAAQVVKRGSDARFDCTFEAAEAIEWHFMDTGPIISSQRYTLHSNGSLSVHRVRGQDEGMYRCVGIGTDKQLPQAYGAELHLAYLKDLSGSSFEPPQPTLEAGTGGVVVVAERSEFEVTCVPPSGVPMPRVWWRGPQGRVVSDSGPTHVDETRLIIESAKSEDAGNYSCIAENMAGISTATIQIVISTPPSIIQDPVSITVDEGASATLTCGFLALEYPITTVRWRRENGAGNYKYVNEDNSHGRPNNGTLHFNYVEVRDRGAYQCEVNTTGFKPVLSKKAHIYVKEKLKFVPPPINKKFELGSFAKLYCKAQGVTPPVIKWIKEGSRMFEFPEHVQDINGTLHFNKVTHGDKGRYSCVATNSQGIINATIEVDVIVFPKFAVAPLNPTEAVEGNAVMIHCIAEGDPKPTIQWDKDSRLNGFDQKRFSVLPNGTLLVYEVHMTDAGKYGCTAGNSGGFKREEVHLIVKSRENYANGGSIEEMGQDGSMMTKTVTITLSAAAAYMLLVVGLMVWCRYRRLRRKQAYLQSGAAEGTNSLLTKAENGDAIGERTEMKDGVIGPGKALREPRGDGADGGSHSHSSGGSGPHGKKSRSSYDKLHFPRQDLTTILTLGHGQFGEVFVAKARGMRGSSSDDEGVVVMVKSLQTRDEAALHDFKREMDMHHKLRHENIARLLGLCRDADPHLMITEYTDWGDLKQLLQATTAAAASRKDGSVNRKPSQPGLPPPLTVAQIIQLANQVARGMEHLANQRMIHRDLAARNCLITSSLVIKISSPALCKDTYVHDYYKYHDQSIPLRWMPYEAVFEDEYSTKSDIWSFAVLMWEMLHAGELPLSKHTDDAILTMLRTRELQWKPSKSLPEPLQAILRSCWADSPRDRPTFSELVQRFEEVCVDSQI